MVAVVVSITALAILLAITVFIWRVKKSKARKPGDIQSLQTVDLA